MDFEKVVRGRDKILSSITRKYNITLEELVRVLEFYSKGIVFDWLLVDMYGLSRTPENWFLFSQTFLRYVFQNKFEGKVNVGREVEIRGCRYLCGLGMKIVITNYRTKAGEIDIICSDNNVIRFVEVRSSFSSFLPEERLDRVKTNKILKTSEDFTSKVLTHEVGYDVLLFDGNRFTYYRDYLV